jgi:hypothetical protein
MAHTVWAKNGGKLAGFVPPLPLSAPSFVSSTSTVATDARSHPLDTKAFLLWWSGAGGDVLVHPYR